MNKIVNKFLSAGDEFMSEMHLRHSRFICKVCRPFTRNKKKKGFKNSKKLEIKGIFIKSNQTKLIFSIAYGDFKDLSKRPAADKVLHDRAFNIAKNPRYDGYQSGLA